MTKRLDLLMAHLDRRSHLIFVASDYHHYRMLGQHLDLEEKVTVR